MIAAIILIAIGIYLGCGLLFALIFVISGVQKIDPHAARGTWGFRLLIIPGTTALWPILLARWVGGVRESPEESNAHRLLAEEPTSETRKPEAL